jgi:integrase/recombinase XerD
MLTTYRRHLKTCKHKAEGRTWRRCTCPIWADGFYEGAEVRESLKVRSWEEADRELAKLKERLTKGTAPEDAPKTLHDAWEDFAKDAKARELREATLRKYKYLRAEMERFASAEGLRFVAEFNLEQLRKWRSRWVNKNVAALKKLEFVRSFLRFCHDAGWIPDNPARKLKSPTVTAKQTMPHTQQEITRILAAIDTHAKTVRLRRRMRALVLVLRYAGLRIGDGVTLSSERVCDGKVFLYTAKSGTPVSCPLPPFVIIALEAALEPGKRFYFWTGNGKKQTATGDWQAKLQGLFKEAGIEDGHAHRFRDTFATELLLAGVPLERVSILLGHSSIRITERHYSPWVRSRQEQLERDVRATWSTSKPEMEGTQEVHAAGTLPN